RPQVVGGPGDGLFRNNDRVSGPQRFVRNIRTRRIVLRHPACLRSVHLLRSSVRSVLCSKCVAKWSKEPSLRRPVRNGENHLGEGTGRCTLQGLTKISGSTVGIVCEITTSPRPQYERVIPVCPGNGQHTMNPLLQEISRLRLP